MNELDLIKIGLSHIQDRVKENEIIRIAAEKGYDVCRKNINGIYESLLYDNTYHACSNLKQIGVSKGDEKYLFKRQLFYQKETDKYEALTNDKTFLFNDKTFQNIFQGSLNPVVGTSESENTTEIYPFHFQFTTLYYQEDGNYIDIINDDNSLYDLYSVSLTSMPGVINEDDSTAYDTVNKYNYYLTKVNKDDKLTNFGLCLYIQKKDALGFYYALFPKSVNLKRKNIIYLNPYFIDIDTQSIFEIINYYLDDIEYDFDFYINNFKNLELSTWPLFHFDNNNKVVSSSDVYKWNHPFVPPINLNNTATVNSNKIVYQYMVPSSSDATYYTLPVESQQNILSLTSKTDDKLAAMLESIEPFHLLDNNTLSESNLKCFYYNLYHPTHIMKLITMGQTTILYGKPYVPSNVLNYYINNNYEYHDGEYYISQTDNDTQTYYDNLFNFQNVTQNIISLGFGLRYHEPYLSLSPSLVLCDLSHLTNLTNIGTPYDVLYNMYPVSFTKDDNYNPVVTFEYGDEYPHYIYTKRQSKVTINLQNRLIYEDILSYRTGKETQNGNLFTFNSASTETLTLECSRFQLLFLTSVGKSLKINKQSDLIDLLLGLNQLENNTTSIEFKSNSASTAYNTQWKTNMYYNWLYANYSEFNLITQTWGSNPVLKNCDIRLNYNNITALNTHLLYGHPAFQLTNFYNLEYLSIPKLTNILESSQQFIMTPTLFPRLKSILGYSLNCRNYHSIYNTLLGYPYEIRKNEFYYLYNCNEILLLNNCSKIAIDWIPAANYKIQNIRMNIFTLLNSDYTTLQYLASSQDLIYFSCYYGLDLLNLAYAKHLQTTITPLDPKSFFTTSDTHDPIEQIKSAFEQIEEKDIFRTTTSLSSSDAYYIDNLTSYPYDDRKYVNSTDYLAFNEAFNNTLHYRPLQDVRSRVSNDTSVNSYQKYCYYDLTTSDNKTMSTEEWKEQIHTIINVFIRNIYAYVTNHDHAASILTDANIKTYFSATLKENWYTSVFGNLSKAITSENKIAKSSKLYQLLYLIRAFTQNFLDSIKNTNDETINIDQTIFSFDLNETCTLKTFYLIPFFLEALTIMTRFFPWIYDINVYKRLKYQYEEQDADNKNSISQKLLINTHFDLSPFILNTENLTSYREALNILYHS